MERQLAGLGPVTRAGSRRGVRHAALQSNVAPVPSAAVPTPLAEVLTPHTPTGGRVAPDVDRPQACDAPCETPRLTKTTVAAATLTATTAAAATPALVGPQTPPKQATTEGLGQPSMQLRSSKRSRPRGAEMGAAAAAAAAAVAEGVAAPLSAAATTAAQQQQQQQQQQEQEVAKAAATPTRRRGRPRTQASAASPSAGAAAAGDGAAAAAAGGTMAPALAAPAVFRTRADVEAAVAHLRAVEPLLGPLIEQHGLPLPLIATAAAGRPDGGAGGCRGGSSGSSGGAAVEADAWDADASTSAAAGTLAAAAAGGGGGGVFSALARSVVYQQLATAAASTIWTRVLAVCQATSTAALTPARVLSASPEALRGAGLSGRKLEYLLGLAGAFGERDGWDEQLAGATSVAELEAALTPLRGIGTWTVHMLAMFHLGGLPDVLPGGDLGVRRGLALLYDLPHLPDEHQAAELTARWRPYRSVGAWYMWRIPPPPRGSGPKQRAATGGKRGRK